MKIVLGPLMFVISLVNYFIYSLSGYQSNLSYRVFRKTYIFTNGIFNDFISFTLKVIKKGFSKNEIESLISIAPSILLETDQFIKSMDKKGYYIFNSRIKESTINNLISDLNNLSVTSVKDNKTYYTQDIEALPEGKSFRQKKDLLQSKSVLNFIFCKEFIYLAQMYLESKPICNNAASWITKPTLDEMMLDVSAQKFHFDMDKIKFIKFFIYLTDVDSKNGPHIYVSSSHKRLPNSLKNDGRFNDETISNLYGLEKIIEITGKKGTLIAVDTRGLHKGKPLTENYRDIFQVEYSNSLFGRKYSTQIEEIEKFNKIERSILK
ncbi:MAG: hypothetical protein HON34_09450 [Pelagibacteraceae bacterium]|jgi:hypothetical protein|nr:hypothetical protein [Pelagibacteraceae bacterium]MBT6170895.1 hypothetical protein [Flavobacteriaceae bacterium]MBT6447561.1 hypothetical protein [Flavobacteriaceae bacterium]MBT7623727.1 hypothetical protein [Flavobacteriaceae bacterium]